jgi:hypothetical protein
MSKSRKRIDSTQASLFDLIQEAAAASDDRAGTFDINLAFREAVSRALKECPLSRYQVAAGMSDLLGCEISKSQLDSWTAESKEQHRFPAVYLPAFCAVTGQLDILKMIGRPVGAYVLPGPDALRAEIERLDEDIKQQQAEKRKRVIYLQQLERS